MEPEIAEQIKEIENRISKIEEYLWTDGEIIRYTRNQLKIIADKLEKIKKML